MNLIIASNNAHKVSEISQVLGKDIRLITMNEIGILDDIPENESSLEGNALVKARYVHSLCSGNVFADDTGLEVEALNGEPGVHSARYAGEARNSELNIDKLLTVLKDHKNRNARFRTVIALIFNEKEFLFEGIVNGSIIDERKGCGGFGYDPVFMPQKHNLTFAEMSVREKNIISHRARAINNLNRFIQKQNQQ